MSEDLRNIDRCRHLASFLLSPISVHSSPDHELNYDEDQEQDSRLDDCDEYEFEQNDDGNDQEQDSNHTRKSFHEVMEKIEREVDEDFAETQKDSEPNCPVAGDTLLDPISSPEQVPECAETLIESPDLYAEYLGPDPYAEYVPLDTEKTSEYTRNASEHR